MLSLGTGHRKVQLRGSSRCGPTTRAARLACSLRPSTHWRTQRSVTARAAKAELDASVSDKKSVVIVGQGWAGFGAAKHLSEQGYDVTLLEASPNPGGLATGWRTAGGREVEAGMKGFWYQYKNIFSLLDELELEEWPLTPFTTSGFWSPRGLVTEAPIFSRQQRLPTLIGQFVHTFPLYWSLSLQDRLTMLPFLATFLDFDSSEETYQKYDRMSAYELFKMCGVSTAAYEEFLKPTLLVGLFAPPEQISAASMLETLYFYAIAHQNDFDVCWCKGTIAERIFQPLIGRIEGAGGKVVGNRLVTGLATNDAGDVTQVTALDRETGMEVTYSADAVVFAIGITGMQKLVSSVPALAAAPEFRAVMNLKSIDVIATRLWLDKKVETKYPANVLSGFEPQAQAGATYFHLNDLQDEYADAAGSVITADFYNASALMPLSDEAVVARIKRHLETCEPQFGGTRVVDSAVLRFPKAVTHFSPGSYASRPYQSTSIANVFLAGDWVKGVPHGANGLSQERAYVTGLMAANLVVSRLGQGQQASILDTEKDEPHVAAGKQAIRSVRETLDSLGLHSPFL